MQKGPLIDNYFQLKSSEGFCFRAAVKLRLAKGFPPLISAPIELNKFNSIGRLLVSLLLEFSEFNSNIVSNKNRSTAFPDSIIKRKSFFFVERQNLISSTVRVFPTMAVDTVQFQTRPKSCTVLRTKTIKEFNVC